MARHQGTEMMRLVERYLRNRRRFGFKFETEAYSLRSFARFASGKREKKIRSVTAVEWSAQGESRLARHTRLLRVIRLAEYLRAEDPGHEIPDADQFRGRYARPKPYIYSSREIELLMQSAAGLRLRGGLRPHTFKALIGLLAATGMRAGEARGLLLDDVLTEQKALFIRGSKSKKGRLNPDSLVDAARPRRVHREASAPGSRWWPSIRNVERHGTVEGEYQLDLRESTPLLGPSTSNPTPSQSPAHVTVRALEACPTEGRDRIGRHMRAISQYLGGTGKSGTRTGTSKRRRNR